MGIGLNFYTLAVVNHGKIGWRWSVMDWGMLIETGCEKNKSTALVKARAVLREKKQIARQRRRPA